MRVKRGGGGVRLLMDLALREALPQARLVLPQAEQVALEQDDRRLADTGAVDRRLVLDVVFKVFRLGKVDGDDTLLELRRRDLVRFARDLYGQARQSGLSWYRSIAKKDDSRRQ